MSLLSPIHSGRAFVQVRQGRKNCSQRSQGPGPLRRFAPSRPRPPRTTRTGLRPGCPDSRSADVRGEGARGRLSGSPEARKRRLRASGGAVRGRRRSASLRPSPGIARRPGPGSAPRSLRGCLAPSEPASAASVLRVCLHTRPRCSGSPLVSLHPGASRCRSFVDAGPVFPRCPVALFGCVLDKRNGSARRPPCRAFPFSRRVG